MAIKKILVANQSKIAYRVHAERPKKNFLPSPETITRMHQPDSTSDLRVNAGLRKGDAITPFDDPLIAKVMISTTDRSAAIKRWLSVLDMTEIEGPSTKPTFLIQVLRAFNFKAPRIGLECRMDDCLVMEPVI